MGPLARRRRVCCSEYMLVRSIIRHRSVNGFLSHTLHSLRFPPGAQSRQRLFSDHLATTSRLQTLQSINIEALLSHFSGMAEELGGTSITRLAMTAPLACHSRNLMIKAGNAERLPTLASTPAQKQICSQTWAGSISCTHHSPLVRTRTHNSPCSVQSLNGSTGDRKHNSCKKPSSTLSAGIIHPSTINLSLVMTYHCGNYRRRCIRGFFRAVSNTLAFERLTLKTNLHQLRRQVLQRK